MNGFGDRHLKPLDDSDILVDVKAKLVYTENMANNWTPEYRSAYMRDRYLRQRQSFIERLGGQCVQCSSIDNLEFDHIDPEQKSFDVGGLFGIKRLPAVYEELAKCQLLCYGCHKRKTEAYNSERMKAQYQSINGEDGFRHGTVYSFMKMKCPCSECESFKREWNNSRNDRRRGVGATVRGMYKPRRPYSPIEVPANHSWCNTHQAFLPLENFTKHRKSKNGYEYDCIECRSRVRSPHLWSAISDSNGN